MNDIRMEVTNEVNGLRSTVELTLRTDDDDLGRLAEVAAKAMSDIRTQLRVTEYGPDEAPEVR